MNIRFLKAGVGHRWDRLDVVSRRNQDDGVAQPVDLPACRRSNALSEPVPVAIDGKAKFPSSAPAQPRDASRVQSHPKNQIEQKVTKATKEEAASLVFVAFVTFC